MRVIAGTARRLQLKTVPGTETRPTTDKIKETLFNIINFDLPGCRFLDLFAGSGAIGIEALSRGASYAAFIEKNPKAAAVIKDNLDHTTLSESADVFTSEALTGVRRISSTTKNTFGIVFMDPPYDAGLEDDVLTCPSFSELIDKDTDIIIEMSINADVEHFEKLGYNVTRVKEYKTNKHVFLRRKSQ